MPFILRMISRAKWDLDDRFNWIEPGDVRADALVTLKTEDDILSVWLIADEKSNLNDVAVALSTTRERLSNFDYALVEYSQLDLNGFRLDEKPGDTKFLSANHWHRNIVRLSGRALLTLAQLIQDAVSKDQQGRIPKKEVKQLMLKAVEEGKISTTTLTPSLADDLK